MSEKFNWQLVRKNPFKFASTITKKVLEQYIKEANKHYYNANSILDDNQYDILVQFLEDKYGKYPAAGWIGFSYKSEYTDVDGFNE